MAGLTVHVLDMGQEKYGDSILCELGETRVLIDGGHSGDIRSRNGYPSIPEQLAELLGHGPPFHVDLLVVTHVHSDHIGCLPALIENDDLRADWALVADERLGFGRALDDSGRGGLDAPGVSPLVRRVVAALREESRADVKDDAALEAFLEDAETLESRYISMLTTLEGRGTRVVRYGRDDPASLVNAFRHVGLRILGPTREHLVICAEAIARFTEDAIAAVSGFLADDAALGAAAAYRALSDQPVSDAEDRPGKGAAINDQSIVLLLEVAGQKALLAGDMQIAKAEVSGLTGLMDALKESVAREAPFDLVKLPHHTSYNGLDEALLDAWGTTSLFAHSGGLQDAGHPDRNVLQLLKRRRGAIRWVRTDRNGLISVALDPGEARLKLSRGRLNDFTPNAVDQPAERSLEPVPALAPAPVVQPPAPARAALRLKEAASTDIVEVIARLPNTPTRVTLSINIEPGRGAPASREAPSFVRQPAEPPRSSADPFPALSIARRRDLPALLFVTSREALARNIGQSEAAHVLAALRAGGLDVYDALPGDLREAAQAVPGVRAQLQAKQFAGVVLLGGYDVIPAQRLDVLDATLRSQVQGHGDDDDFIVWSDSVYGDRDGDGLPEIPVSRIPDAKSADLVFAALGTAPAQNGRARRFGLRNVQRPFAGDIFNLIAGGEGLLVSEVTTPKDIPAGAIAGGAVYLMLHGADHDGSKFWGEDNAGTLEAFNLGNVPQQCDAVVFAGCCWGALPVERPAVQLAPGQPVAPRATEASIALSFLRAGAKAFIGCTGTHYSPTVPPYQYYGGPLHRAFWQRYQGGMPPAKALFEAKREYLRGMPHGRRDAMSRAIEQKILRQFTCLGLGW